jgi:hypothetical protein
MITISRLAVLACLVAGFAFGAGAASAQDKTANAATAGNGNKTEPTELSMKSVKLITGFALTTIPSEIKQPDGKMLKIDRSKLDKILVPLEDARRIIIVARNSAHAQSCDMLDLQADNYLAMINSERAKNKWTPEQLLFINRLHLFTVMWLTGNVKFLEKDGKKEPTVISQSKAPEKKACTDQDKAQIKATIDAYVKSVQKS